MAEHIEKIKEIVSTFTKIPVSDIGPGTPMDRRAVKSSILLHRMYAKLAEEGVVIENYTAIKTFSDLLGDAGKGNSATAAAYLQPAAERAVATGSPAPGGIGIDVEELSSLPRTHDFRKEEFYTMNFTPSEMAYCILQPDPYASFAGLFSAKEAIVKADGGLRSRPFNAIGITHSPEGVPLYPGFHLSISHAGSVAVAVAVPVRMEEAEKPVVPQGSPAGRGGASMWLGVLALLLSVLAIILGFRR